MAFLEHGLEPDCLVLDLALPDGNGEDILKRIRQRGLRTRVAVCTGNSDPHRLEVVRSMRPEGLLYKPVDLAELEKVCRFENSTSV
jgi:DNA-binding NarL/FixJ family response regulator